MNRFLNILPWILTIIFGIIMIRTTIPNGHDLTVYYIAAKEAFSPEGIYSVIRDGNLVFKYPPWIVTFFLPLGQLELPSAKMIWGVVQAISLYYCVVYLYQNKIHPLTSSVCLLAFAPLWIIHAYAGQIALPLTALCLRLENVFIQNKRGFSFIALSTILSSKLFTLLPLLAFRWKKTDFKWISWTILFWFLLCVPFLLHEGFDLFQNWFEAMRSGKPIEGFTQHVHRIHVTPTSRDHQGWISFVFKNLGGDPRNLKHMLLITWVVASSLLLFWKWRVKNQSKQTEWIGWIAWVSTIHPLSGFFSFVGVFPLAAFSLNDAFQNKDSMKILMTLSGIVMLTAITQKTIGGHWGGLFETLCAKSFGVLLLSISLTRRAKA